MKYYMVSQSIWNFNSNDKMLYETDLKLKEEEEASSKYTIHIISYGQTTSKSKCDMLDDGLDPQLPVTPIIHNSQTTKWEQRYYNALTSKTRPMNKVMSRGQKRKILCRNCFEVLINSLIFWQWQIPSNLPEFQPKVPKVFARLIKHKKLPN